VYLAIVLNAIQNMLATGTNQTNLLQLNSQASSNASISVDTIPGSSAGAFSWSTSGTQWGTGWGASAVAVLGASTGSVQPNPGAAVLASSGARMNLGITPHTAKVRDAVKRFTRKYFIPNVAQPGKLICA
jgi:hypothetical protein